MHDKLIIKKIGKFANNKLIVISCTNYDYIRVAVNWARHLTDLGVKNYVVFALDMESHEILIGENINTILFEIRAENWDDLKYYKLKIPYEILKTDIDVLWSDLDAVWLRNPLELIDPVTCDIMGSIVEHDRAWPPTAREAWKFTICTGWIYFRNTPSSSKMLGDILEVTPFSCDQKIFNEFLLKQNPVVTPMKDGSKLLATDQLTVRVLSSSIVNRGDNMKGVYVCHPLSDKNGLDTERVLKREGLWLAKGTQYA